MKTLLRKHFIWFSKKFDRDSIGSFAAESSFWIIIAFIPFTLFILTLMQTIRIEDVSLLFAFIRLLPAPIERLLSSLFSELKPPSGLLSMTAILCVWSASNGTQAMIKGIYSVFDVKRRRNIIKLRLMALLYTVMLAVALTLGLGLFLIARLLKDKLKLHSFLSVPLFTLMPVAGFIVLLLLFWMLFWLVPRKRVSARFAFIGAAVSSAGWCLFSFFFSIFVENFSNYATVYGSLAAIIILMMWLYFCMFILFIGGETAMWLQYSSIRSDIRTAHYSAHRQRAEQKGRKK